MTGAIAGTAILHAKEKGPNLHTVTLTVNNSCNLECDHCYLQYFGRGVLSESDSDIVLNANFGHLAMVGKEPTLNSDLVERLVNENKRRGRKSSLITNGVNLPRLSDNALQSLDYVDVSFDGGKETYSQRRKYDFDNLISNLKAVSARGLKEINALHTIYTENLENLEDMVQISEHFPFNKIAFSMYKVPHNYGNVKVSRSSLFSDVLPRFSQSRTFVENPNTILLLSGVDVTSGDSEHLLETVEKLGLSGKTHYVEDPMDYGFVRVTYDGKVLTPHDAIHPIFYKTRGYSLNDSRFNGLNEIFEKLRLK